MAVAAWKQVNLSRLELFLEGDIGNPAAWGAGGALQIPAAEMGFQAIRVQVLIEGDASETELQAIVDQQNHYSPVINMLRNPVPLQLKNLLPCRAEARGTRCAAGRRWDARRCHQVSGPRLAAGLTRLIANLP
jgi:hypothetical protein